jgi:ribosome modulation factor
MTQSEQFDRFLTLVARYLYDQGWYTQSHYVQTRTTYEAVEEYLENHCYSREKSRLLVEQFRQQATQKDMTDNEQKRIWDEGWKAFWDGKKQDACPDYPEQEQRDEWMSGWLTAQSSEESASPTEIS